MGSWAGRWVGGRFTPSAFFLEILDLLLLIPSRWSTRGPDMGKGTAVLPS